MSVLRLEVPEVFAPLMQPVRFKGAWGGRGSGKSHFFATKTILRSLAEPGFRIVCIREIQKTLAQSVKQLIEDKINKAGVADQFDILEREIRTPGNGLIVFQGMQNHTAHSIKSLEGFDVAWVEEAQTLSARSLNMLRPTIRKAGSELWFSWNPDHEHDPVDKFLRGQHRPPNSIVVQANYLDNPWISDELLDEAQLDQNADPDKYAHVWLGEYAKAVEGAYYADDLRRADNEGRITALALDPVQSIKASWDLGVADATAIWVAQWAGNQIRFIDYIEGQGQPLAYYLNELRARGYERAECILPHDGAQRDGVTALRFEDHVRSAGFTVNVVKNQGRGAAMQRVAAGRRWFPRMWFDAEKTLPGRKALASYHERRDEVRQIGLGPEHDWASHGCFVGTTKVLTPYGTCQIMDLPETGRVLTPCGWRQYVNPRLTKRNAPLVEVAFVDGYTVKCTPDHLFLTVSGWKSASSLKTGSLIRSTLTPSRSISMGASSVCGRVRGIYRAAADAFISRLGVSLSVQFRRDATFTIETVMFSTTGSIISNASPRTSISAYPETVAHIKRALVSRPTLAHRLPNGIDPKKAGSGIGAMPNEHRVGKNGSASHCIVWNAAMSSWRWFVNQVTRKSTARRHARLVRIISVRNLSERADVWDITVPWMACFSLANGAVVHNSDSFGLMATAYLEPTHSIRPKPRDTSWIV